jgi:hypothetical protein
MRVLEEYESNKGKLLLKRFSSTMICPCLAVGGLQVVKAVYFIHPLKLELQMVMISWVFRFGWDVSPLSLKVR